MYDYDLVVIGSGPGGQKAAIAAAKLDRRVAVVDRPDMLGGVCVNTGTIPSKTLREAILHLTGLDQREIYGQSYRVKDDITVADLTAGTRHVVYRENDVVRSQLARNRVTILGGFASFAGPTPLRSTTALAGLAASPPIRSWSRPVLRQLGRQALPSTRRRSSTQTASSTSTRCLP